MDTIFTNSRNVKHSILIDYYSILQIKQSYREEINMLINQILAFTMYGIYENNNTEIIDLKYQLWYGMKNLN